MASNKKTGLPDYNAMLEQLKLPGVDFAKVLEQMKVPGVDMTALVEAQRKDIEALTQITQQAYEGVQTLAQRQAEILRESMEIWQKVMGSSQSGDRAEAVGHAMSSAVANMRELAEITVQSQTRVYETIQKRLQEQFEQAARMGRPK